MAENPAKKDIEPKKISLEEGRRLAVQIFDRQRPGPQKLTQEERQKLNKIRGEISDLLKKVRSMKEK
jgi:hypothetical protein